VSSSSESGRGSVVEPVLFVLLWSSGAIVLPFGLAEVSPLPFLAVRAAGCAVVAWAVWALVRDALPAGRRGWARTVLVALLMQGAYQSCFFTALDQGIRPGLLVLIVSAQPLLTALVSRSRGPLVWLALLLGLAGVGLAVGADPRTGALSITGLVAACGALLAISAGTLVQSRASAGGVWAGLAVQSTISAVLFAALTGLLGAGRWHPGVAFAVSAGWMILLVSVGATALLYRMIRHRDAVAVTGLFFVVPTVTALGDHVVNGTVLTLPVTAGFALTVVALLLVRRATTSPRAVPVRRRPSDRVADSAASATGMEGLRRGSGAAAGGG
jgi:drug/metabolite transporter (DMT)-like permease